MTTRPTITELRLTWSKTDHDPVVYALWALDTDGQTSWVGDFAQGPFDTALDVAQWAWRSIARVVPPAAC